jgi:hypothetical protein
MAGRTSHYTTDHDRIREWVEERGGRPTAVRGTSRRGTGILRIDFPGYSGGGKLEEISWEDFFDKFDDENLVFLYQDRTARGQKSNFNKLVRVSDEMLEDDERNETAGRARPTTGTSSAGRSGRGSGAGTRSRRSGGTPSSRGSSRRGEDGGTSDSRSRGGSTRGSTARSASRGSRSSGASGSRGGGRSGARGRGGSRPR